MPSLHSQFIFLVPMYLAKPSFLDPRIKSGSPGFPILSEACKYAKRSALSWLSVVVSSGANIHCDSKTEANEFFI